MSKSTKLKKQAEKERKEFKPYEGRNKNERHIRLTKDMLMDKVYLSLSCPSRVLYNYMKLWAYGSKEYKDKGTFDYSVSLAMQMCGVSNKTAIKCFHELEEKGFIERQNNSKFSKQTSKWKFSSKWAETSTDMA